MKYDDCYFMIYIKWFNNTNNAPVVALRQAPRKAPEERTPEVEEEEGGRRKRKDEGGRRKEEG